MSIKMALAKNPEPDSMKLTLNSNRTVYIVLLLSILISCARPGPVDVDIVDEREQLDAIVARDIETILDYATEHHGRISPSTKIDNLNPVKKIYERKEKPIWATNGKLLPQSDSLLHFIRQSKYYGLFPSDYHYKQLNKLLTELRTDSLEQLNAISWSRADILLTDAFFSLCHHLRLGHLPADTLSLRRDTTVSFSEVSTLLDAFMTHSRMSLIVSKLEPRHLVYRNLKQALQKFLDTVSVAESTYLLYPIGDSTEFSSALVRRLSELSYFPGASSDTAGLYDALKNFQRDAGIKITGKINEATVIKLNESNEQRFRTAALTIDKIKSLPDTLPSRFLWVNIPGYLMQLQEYDSVLLRSKIIVGTAATRTPELSSAITDFIIYPQWTVPYSIVFKEMLPQIRKNIAYLAKQNLMVIDRRDSVIDPASIDWSKIKPSTFSYQIRQRQGDDNSLGILKFNFKNKYSVYLHDTNARWLFSKTSRALSHGCVRVQNWRQLVDYLVSGEPDRYPSDSLQNWLSRGQKKTISGFESLPIFIRYFTCEAIDGDLVFYDDIYGQDKLLCEKYLVSKSLN